VLHQGTARATRGIGDGVPGAGEGHLGDEAVHVGAKADAAAGCVLRITGKFIEAASVQNLPTECLDDIQPIPFDISQ
jgi:hypothetical protein